MMTNEINEVYNDNDRIQIASDTPDVIGREKGRVRLPKDQEEVVIRNRDVESIEIPEGCKVKYLEFDGVTFHRNFTFPPIETLDSLKIANSRYFPFATMPYLPSLNWLVIWNVKNALDETWAIYHLPLENFPNLKHIVIEENAVFVREILRNFDWIMRRVGYFHIRYFIVAYEKYYLPRTIQITDNRAMFRLKGDTLKPLYKLRRLLSIVTSDLESAERSDLLEIGLNLPSLPISDDDILNFLEFLPNDDDELAEYKEQIKRYLFGGKRCILM